jgi:hypothetical protein
MCLHRSSGPCDASYYYCIVSVLCSLELPECEHLSWNSSQRCLDRPLTTLIGSWHLAQSWRDKNLEPKVSCKELDTDDGYLIIREHTIIHTVIKISM